ncbi:uncharacterized protein Zcchc7 [Eurosta solidaginis]|uniref:uncharacterized protein Zcchc7 n=1 Tax=Eurosta solidaginis TaxID=178769 RepID=UPI0035311BEA
MDEVDLDGEDYNELEARLYGQIHHEAADETPTASVVDAAERTQPDSNGQAKQGEEKMERIVTATSVVNRPANASRVPGTRYWVGGAGASSNENQNKIFEKNETPNPTTNAVVATAATSKCKAVAEKNQKNTENKVSHAVVQQPSEPPQTQLQQQEQEEEDIEPEKTSGGSQFILNPAALIKNAKAKKNKNKKKKQNQPHLVRTGPFKQQETKLQKALLIKAKKQKSKKVRDKTRKGVLRANDTIVLESSTEDDGESEDDKDGIDDDVVLVPIKSPPLITLSDSDNDEQQDKGGTLNMGDEENAMDSSDVVIEKENVKSNNFTKPADILSNIATKNDADKRVGEQISRCASPSSVLSSDDFIGQSDRRRLLDSDNCTADDQDLALLTADVDSLMQAPAVEQAKKGKKKSTALTQQTTDDVVCTAEFIAPVTELNATTITTSGSKTAKTGKQQTNDYRVEHPEFRALDVYESESDINDGVYSKGIRGGRANTIINAIDSSSDADDVQQTPKSQKIKKLSKRRLSSFTNNRSQDDPSTDDDDGGANDENDGVAKTPIPYIMRGTAIERCNKKLRKRAQSLCSRASGLRSAAGTLSDTEFIATLNSLVQGQTTATADDQSENERFVPNNEEDEKEEDETNINDEQEAVTQIAYVQDADQQNDEEPSQFIANRPIKTEPDQESLASVQIIERPPPPAFLSEAVPDEAMAGMDKIFESIDKLVEKPVLKKSTNYDNASSDDEIEVIQPPVTSSAGETSSNQNNLPIRNVVYSERGPQLGGIGWNDEMVKFYNFSWHGEHFSLIGVHNKLEKDRNLWKILNEDRFPKKRPYSNLKCYNCCEFGHTRAKCQRPKKPLICYMCGESGHLEPRCPNTICLRCGNKTQVFTRSCNACTFQNRLICPICKVRGHAINLCPDKWRRYHSTTQPNAHPNSHIEFNRRKVCCVCGGVGHFSDTCRNPARFMDYPVIVSQVKSHQKSYEDLLFKTPRVGIAFNLLYRPGETYTFRMSEKTPVDGYYGRFLKAVGLGHLLISRKRPFNCIEDTPIPVKQAKSFTQHYQPNPYGNKAKANSASTGNVTGMEEESAPDQVQEISGSVNEDEIGHMENNSNENDEQEDPDGNEANESNTAIDSMNSRGNEFKAPNEVPAAQTTAGAMQIRDNIAMDSDSNYSFSEHFEMPATADDADNVDMENEDAPLDDQPSTSAAAAAKKNTSAKPPTKQVREMGTLPEYIPLSDTSDLNISDDNFEFQAGISKCFVADVTDDDDENVQHTAQATTNIPCEAKIYLTNFHSNYLLSPDGHEFLVNKSNECNIKARLDWTSVGHVLVIFGLPQQQDIFHKALLVKCHELMDQMNNKQMNATIKVPKRIDVLIRYLRDNISQLQSDLGDVNELQRRIKNCEKTHTKPNIKLAEKCRRLLNMILLGQAGLCDGDKHLDKLLISLKSLINDYQAEHVVPQSLREEIDSHAKMIFTSYRHNNYNELIQSYNRLTKQQKNNINIDPLLLGQTMLDTTLTPEQRVRLTQGAVPAGNSQPPTPTTPTYALQQAARRFEDMSHNNAPFVVNSPNIQKSVISPNNQKYVNSPNNQKNFKSPNNQKFVNSPSIQKSKMFMKQNWAPFSGPQYSAQRPAAFNNNKNQNYNNNNQNYNNNNNQNYNNRVKFNTNAPTKRQNMPPQQKSTVFTKFHGNQQQQYNAHSNMFAGKSGGAGNNARSRHMQQQQQYGTVNNSSAGSAADMQRGPAKGPSVFWSRESMRYLDECLQLAESNADIMQKLKRIQSKSLEGALSYNDYRAVIKLHGAMTGN